MPKPHAADAPPNGHSAAAKSHVRDNAPHAQSTEFSPAAPPPGPASPFAPAPGATVHGYTLDRMLGAGGFGAVWLAHTIDREPFALKFCTGLNDDALAALHREAALYGRLRAAMPDGARRPPIIALKHNLLHADPPALAMEFAAGGDLRQYMAARAHRPLTFGESLPIIRDVLEALEFAHAMGIVHRDLSPENILFDPRDDRWKVADFGLASARFESALSLMRSGQSREAPHTIAGKLHYMAPEQQRGEAATPAADLWALGIVWAQVLTGQLDHGLPPLWAMEVPIEAVKFVSSCLRPRAADRMLRRADLEEARARTAEEERLAANEERAFGSPHRPTLRPPRSEEAAAAEEARVAAETAAATAALDEAQAKRVAALLRADRMLETMSTEEAERRQRARANKTARIAVQIIVLLAVIGYGMSRNQSRSYERVAAKARLSSTRPRAVTPARTTAPTGPAITLDEVESEFLTMRLADARAKASRLDATQPGAAALKEAIDIAMRVQSHLDGGAIAEAREALARIAGRPYAKSTPFLRLAESLTREEQMRAADSFERAEREFEAGRYQSAESFATRAVQVHPQHAGATALAEAARLAFAAQARMDLAAARSRAGAHDEAAEIIASARAAIRTDASVEAMARLGGVEQRLDDLYNHAKWFAGYAAGDAPAALEFFDKISLERRGRQKLQAEADRQREVHELMRAATTEQTVAAAAAVLQREPDSTNAYHARARRLMDRLTGVGGEPTLPAWIAANTHVAGGDEGGAPVAIIGPQVCREGDAVAGYPNVVVMGIRPNEVIFSVGDDVGSAPVTLPLITP